MWAGLTLFLPHGYVLFLVGYDRALLVIIFYLDLEAGSGNMRLSLSSICSFPCKSLAIFLRVFSRGLYYFRF